MDSHCVTGVLLAESQKFGARVCEGAFWLSVTAPSRFPCSDPSPPARGLLVPVAASATHVGYSALRMEPADGHSVSKQARPRPRGAPQPLPAP